MQSSQVSLTSFSLNLNRTLEQGLVLNKGEMVSGLIQEVKPDGMLALLIKGKLVEAFSEVRVSQGEQVFLSVEDFREGRTYLKLITPEALGQQRESGLALNLQKLGVDPAEANLVIAKKLIQYNLPVTRDNIMEASRAVKILGGYSQENTEVAVLSRAARLPTNEFTLKALASFLKEPDDVGRLVGNLIQLLGDMPDEPAFSAPVSSNRSEINHQSGLIVRPDAMPTEESNTPIVVKLPSGQFTPRQQPVEQPIGKAQVIQNQTVSGETGEALPLSSRTSNDAGSAPTSTPLPEESAEFWSQTRNAIRTLLRDLIIRISETPEYNANKMEARPRETAELVKSLNTLQSILKNVDHSTRPEVQQVLSSLENLEKELSGQQMLNSFIRLVGGQENSTGVYYLAFPVQVEQGVQQVQIRVQHNSAGKQNLRQAENLSLVVSLDTGQMGKVLFHADWTRAGRLGIMGVVENEPVGRFLEGGLPGLVEALTELGYQVQNRGISVSRDMKQEAHLHPSLVESREEPSLVAIDITV